MKRLVISLVLLLSISVALAHGDAIAGGKELVESKISCDNLTSEQLEEIGEYQMELMHPGQSHEMMHQMMGFKEGDEAEEEFHINLAKTMYCSDSSAMAGMDMGMMNMIGGQGMQGNMMGNMGGSGRWNFTNQIIYTILLIGIVVLVYLGIYKLWLWKPKHKKDSSHNNGGLE